jgi:hypothetical protein
MCLEPIWDLETFGKNLHVFPMGFTYAPIAANLAPRFSFPPRYVLELTINVVSRVPRPSLAVRLVRVACGAPCVTLYSALVVPHLTCDVGSLSALLVASTLQILLLVVKSGVFGASRKSSPISSSSSLSSSLDLTLRPVNSVNFQVNDVFLSPVVYKS